MTTTLYLLTLVLPLATVLVVFGLRAYASVEQARARLAHDDAYRQLAERASSAQSQIANSLAAMEVNLSEMRARGLCRNHLKGGGVTAPVPWPSRIPWLHGPALGRDRGAAPRPQPPRRPALVKGRRGRGARPQA